jgi:nitrite reductase/ring-hydroxylating ferredoxin subunit
VSRFVPVFAAADLAPGAGRLVRVEGKEIAVFNVGGTFRAVDDTCLHAGGPLHEGTLDGTTVTCPWHDWRFDGVDVRCEQNPTARLGCYPDRVRDGQVEIAVDGA